MHILGNKLLLQTYGQEQKIPESFVLVDIAGTNMI